jgi:hypothetical protein
VKLGLLPLEPDKTKLCEAGKGVGERAEGVFRIGTQLNPEFLLHADYP